MREEQRKRKKYRADGKCIYWMIVQVNVYVKVLVCFTVETDMKLKIRCPGRTADTAMICRTADIAMIHTFILQKVCKMTVLCSICH